LIETIVSEFPMMRIVLDQHHGSICVECCGEVLLGFDDQLKSYFP